MRKASFLFWSFITLVALVLNSCKDDTSFFTKSADLTLRTDTLFFDTVFTSTNSRIPMSVNKQIIVVNPYKQAVKSSFRLRGGAESVFRINVDGEVGPEVDEIEIGANDSVFVFVELSVEPNNDPNSLPLIVRDSIEIITNGNVQHTQLVAWGQDAHYYFRDSVCNEVFDDQEKPYVIYGYLYIPENCTLTIKEGVKLHFAPRSWLYVEGTLKVEGVKGNEVRMEGDRLQPAYEEVAGQWGGVWLNYLSEKNTIKHAIIKNGTVGIYCDSSIGFNEPNVVVENTMVRNMSFDGLSGKSAFIQARNSIFTNCGRYSFLGLWGGIYDLKHCNFTTYSFDFNRRDPTFALNNVRINEFFQIEQAYYIQYDVQNCIVDGGLDEELSFGIFKDLPSTAFGDTLFNNNLVKSERKFIGIHQNNVLNETPAFKDILNHDYNLELNSGAIDIGATNLSILLDYNLNSRDAMPDAGAIEFQK